MRKTGLIFVIEGEYATRYDENGEFAEWEPFETRDLRRDGLNSITVWSQMEKLDDREREALVEKAVTVVDWLREERGWIGFVAELILMRCNTPSETVFEWNLG